jgi:hypothetical protein
MFAVSGWWSGSSGRCPSSKDKVLSSTPNTTKKKTKNNNNCYKYLKNNKWAGHWRLTLVILEAEIRRIAVQSQPR